MVQEPKEVKPRSRTAFFILVGMSTAILLVAPVFILLLIGFALDALFGTQPTFMLIGVGLGLVSGSINIFRLMKMMQKIKK